MQNNAFNVPDGALLDPEVRKALDPQTFRSDVFMPHIVDPAVVAQDAVRLERAKAWTAGKNESGEPNADCLTCGLCCRQGWRVDVRATDLPRMSAATYTRMVDAPPKGAPAHVVGVLRILDFEGSKKCPAQTTHPHEGRATGCDIYEERPETCRTFPVGHARCVVLRAEAGLPFEP